MLGFGEDDMTTPLDPTALSALKTQARELTHLLWRLESARRTMVPAPVTSWRGLARMACDTAVGTLESTMDDAIRALRSAIDSINEAVAEATWRG